MAPALTLTVVGKLLWLFVHGSSSDSDCSREIVVALCAWLQLHNTAFHNLIIYLVCLQYKIKCCFKNVYFIQIEGGITNFNKKIILDLNYRQNIGFMINDALTLILMVGSPLAVWIRFKMYA
jgi:hypothetical protein